MKNQLLLILMGVFSWTGLFAQGNYEKGMQKAFQHWEAQETEQAVALFERIAQAESERWLPSYYAANVLISSSFMTQDKSRKQALLEKAKAYIAEAHERSSENSEVHTLEGLLYTAYVAMDPQTYAMQYGQKIMDLHQKAITLDKNNPRAHANLIEYEMGTARFFGQDLAPFCKRMQKVIPLFENQEKEMPFAPTYGLERAQRVAQSCQ